MTESHYDVIGVDTDASKDEIRDAYRGRLDELREQVEKGRNDQAREQARDATARLNAAWQVLSDPFQRQRYDARLAEGGEEPEEETREVVPARSSWRSRTARERPSRPARQGRGERRPPEGVPGADPAPVGKRALAVAIDIITLEAVLLAVGSAIASVLDVKKNQFSASAFVASTIAVLALITLYFVVPTWRTGQTLGKRITRVMAVDAGTGRLPTFGRALLRYAVPGVLLVMPLASIGTMIALLFGLSWLLIDTRVGLMDRLGRTRVVLAQYRPEHPAPARGAGPGAEG